MNIHPSRLAASAFSIAVLAGCGATGASETQIASGRTASTSDSPGSGERICAGTRQPAPAPSLTFAAVGHPGNAWSLPVDADGVTVRFRIIQRPSTTVTSMRFVIAPANAPHPGSEIRRFAPVGENWTPGEHAAVLTWDGKDGDGRPVAPGLYRLFSEAITTTTRDVKCADGSGRGIEKFSGTHEGAGLGLFRVGRIPARRCPTERDVNDPRLERAAEDVRALPASVTDEHFTGLILCHDTVTMTLYRTPGDREFDRTLRHLVERHGAEIVFADTAYTKSELERAEDEIWKRLRRARDYRIVSVSLRPQGYLEVGVVGDLARARAALAGYKDQVRVVKGAVGTPL